MDGRTARELRLGADGGKTAEWLIGLVDLEVFYKTHPGAPVPDCTTLSIRVRDGSDGERRAHVNAIAEALGVHPVERGDGTYMAARMFGPLTVEAHFTPQPVRDRIVRDTLHLPAQAVPVVAA